MDLLVRLSARSSIRATEQMRTAVLQVVPGVLSWIALYRGHNCFTGNYPEIECTVAKLSSIALIRWVSSSDSRSSQGTDDRFGVFLEDPEQGLGRPSRPPASLLPVLERALAEVLEQLRTHDNPPLTSGRERIYLAAIRW